MTETKEDHVVHLCISLETSSDDFFLIFKTVYL